MTFDAPAGRSSSASEIRTHAERLFRTYFPQWIGLLEKTRAQDILRTDISDLRPLTQWSSGRIGLIGDAAHAATPNLGQGGAMAVEDALVLADAFKSSASTRQHGSTLNSLDERRWIGRCQRRGLSGRSVISVIRSFALSAISH